MCASHDKSADSSSSRPQAVPTVQLDNERVIVTEWRFAPGAETGWHVHGFDYVITTLTDCHMRLDLPGGEVTTVMVPAGSAYRRDSGVAHNVINAGDAPMAFVEVEIKPQ